MNDNITLPRSVVEQALEAWEQARGALAYVAVGNAPSNPNLARSTCSQAVWVLDNAEPALRAALEQAQVEQEPIAWANINKQGDITHTSNKKMAWAKTPLYTHPQPPRQPLTDKVRSLIGSMVSELRAHRYCGDCYPENGWPEVNSVLAEYAAFKRAHGIGGDE